MDLTTAEIVHTLEQHAPTIRRYGVRSLGLFGSHARGTAGMASDLDFVVEFEAKSFDAYMDLKAFLEQLFGARVDLVLRVPSNPGCERGSSATPSMPRDSRVYLEDILGAIAKIKRYTTGLSLEQAVSRLLRE